MKKILFVLLGTILALMAITIVAHLDLVTIWFSVPCAFGAYRLFRAARSPRT